MIPLYILAGLSLGIAALAVLIIALAVLVRALASFLSPASQFLGDLQNLREWSDQRAEQMRRRVAEATGTPAAPVPSGVAPPPVFDFTSRRVAPQGVAPAPEGPTSANLPPVVVGDVDRFDAAAAEEFLERPVAEGSRHAAKPPGPPVQGEEGF